jgi:hypothetical protein
VVHLNAWSIARKVFKRCREIEEREGCLLASKFNKILNEEIVLARIKNESDRTKFRTEVASLVLKLRANERRRAS